MAFTSGTHCGITKPVFRQLWLAGPNCGVAVGAPEYREIWQRSGERNHVWSVIGRRICRLSHAFAAYLSVSIPVCIHPWGGANPAEKLGIDLAHELSAGDGPDNIKKLRSASTDDVFKAAPRHGLGRIYRVVHSLGTECMSGGKDHSMLGTNRVIWFALHPLCGISAVKEKESRLGKFIP